MVQLTSLFSAESRSYPLLHIQPDEVDRILDKHISKLHDYNEIKDVAQIIISKCAEFEQASMKETYRELGIDPET